MATDVCTSKPLIINISFIDIMTSYRVNPSPSPDQPSGFGFELTFRLLSDAETPPTWPAELLQALARYVFSSDNALCVGDHISWHTALDQADSSIQHMLLAVDPQLKAIRSPLGYVNFVQVSTLDMCV